MSTEEREATDSEGRGAVGRWAVQGMRKLTAGSLADGSAAGAGEWGQVHPWGSSDTVLQSKDNSVQAQAG